MEPIGILKDGQIYDLQTALALDIQGEEIKADDSKESLDILRHSCAHMMAQAIKELYPEAKFFVGPVVKEGFYYDFKVESKISDEDLPTIEKKMKEIADRKLPITRHETTKEEFLEKFKNDELKQAVLKNIKDTTLTIYKQGDFEDLCRGPHLPNTRMIRSFKLTRVAGAYLGGDEKNEMITRIYGIAFFDKQALFDYSKMIEEAKKRDHRKLGTELELFTFNDDVGAGLPMWLPNGARLRSKLEHILYKAHRIRGYEPVRGPEILKAEMWKISGHYANYKENMYFTTIDEQEYGIKPMNCVGHIQIFKNSLVSYKDLPKKLFEYGVVHRHEKSGVLHGLFRVREFTQDDAHIFCTKDQVKGEFQKVLQLTTMVIKKMGFDNFTAQISLRDPEKPEKYIGSEENWQAAEQGIIDAVSEFDIETVTVYGEAAFYGPKLDFMIKDALGRSWQLGTIQVDYNLPERFELEYVGADNQTHRPVMIHRAPFGSMERFISIMIEHTAGKFPLWLTPDQYAILPISDRFTPYCEEIKQALAKHDIRGFIDDRAESIGRKIRDTELKRVPIMLIIGDKEFENGQVSVRRQGQGDVGSMSVAEFVSYFEAELEKQG